MPKAVPGSWFQDGCTPACLVPTDNICSHGCNHCLILRRFLAWVSSPDHPLLSLKPTFWMPLPGGPGGDTNQPVQTRTQGLSWSGTCFCVYHLSSRGTLCSGSFIRSLDWARLSQLSYSHLSPCLADMAPASFSDLTLFSHLNHLYPKSHPFPLSPGLFPQPHALFTHICPPAAVSLVHYSRTDAMGY